MNANTASMGFKRPIVKCTVSNESISLLYDSGAQVSVLSSNILKRFPKACYSRCPSPNVVRASCASGAPLDIVGRYLVKMSILGKPLQHEFLVCRNLRSNGLIGIDLIQKYSLSYSSVSRKVFFDTNEPVVARTKQRTFIPAGARVKTTVRIDGPILSENQILLIGVPNEQRIAPGEVLISADDQKLATIFLSNVGERAVELPRGVEIGLIEAAQEVRPWDKDKSPSVSRTCPILEAKPKTASSQPSAERKKRILELLNLDHLPEALQVKYRALVMRFHEVFSCSEFDIGKCSIGMHKIPLKNENSAIFRKQFSLPHHQQLEVNRQLREWLSLALVRRTESEFNSPLFAVRKKTREGEPQKWRIVQDFRDLNNETEKSNIRLPEVEESILSMCQDKPEVFSAIDLRSGFWNVPIHPDDQDKTAFFVKNQGQFAWTRAPQGLAYLPASFQRIMTRLFKSQLERNVSVIYLDDVLNFASNHTEMLAILEESFQLLLNAGFKINLEKTTLGAPRLTYLGFEVDKYGYRPDSTKTQAILKSPVPQTLKAVRAWIGMCNFYRKHIRDFSRVIQPLTALTGGGRVWSGGELPATALRAFNEIKSRLCDRPILSYPDFNKQFFLFVDGSLGKIGEDLSGGLGAMLVQYDDESKLEGPHCIGYASRTLLKSEKNYSSYLIESLAACFGVEKFDKFLLGQKFVLYSDHKPLLKVGTANHTRTHERLKEILAQYVFELRHYPGALMPADLLSRFTQPTDSVETVHLTTLGGILGAGKIEERLAKFQREQMEDPFVAELMCFVKTKKYNDKGNFKNLAKRYGPSCFLRQGVLYIDLNRPGFMNQQCLVLPAMHHASVIAEAHGSKIAGHAKQFKTEERVVASYWWPSFRQDISDFIQDCAICNRLKPLSGKNAPFLQPLEAATILNERIHLDLYGPLRSNEGKQWVLVIIDSFSKFAAFAAISSKEPEQVADALFKNWVAVFGLPSCIVTDRGTEFRNKLMKNLTEEMGVEMRFCSTQQPRTNGQCEMMMKKIRSYLSSMCQDRPLDWAPFLPSCQLSWNSSVNKATKASPFSLLFGLEARSPMNSLSLDARPFYSDDYQAELMKRLQIARKLARDNNMKYRSDYKDYHDSKNGNPYNWVEGQMVWLHSPELVKVNPKIVSPYVGPFVILSVVSDHNVLIQHLQSKRTKMVNVRRLRPYNVETKNLGRQSAEDVLNPIKESSLNSSGEEQSSNPEYLEIEGFPDVEILNPLDPPPQPIPVKVEQDSVPESPPRHEASPGQFIRARQLPSPSDIGGAMARPFQKLTRTKAKQASVLLPPAGPPPSIPPEHSGRLKSRAHKATLSLRTARKTP